MPDSPPAGPLWTQSAVWRVLDTDFGQGLHFLRTWHAWLQDAQPSGPAPRRLHYTGLRGVVPPDFAVRLQDTAAPCPHLSTLAQQLAAQLWGLLPGFHRIELSQGRVTLTLCIGSLQSLLQAQDFQADEIRLSGGSGMGAVVSAAPVWDRWMAKALARLCRRGTRCSHSDLLPEEQAALIQAGFDFSSDTYAPRWALRRTRQSTRAWPAAPGRCAVIGAGLAGASTAAALARRGWQVDVYDTAATPAAGASGLPAGLLLPHVSADDSPRSRLSRVGVRMTLQQAQALLQEGQDWQASGVLEHRIDKSPGLPACSPEAARQADDWSRQLPLAPDASWAADMRQDVPSLWHPHAGWVKPAALVRAWLRQPGVRFIGQAAVGAIRPDGAGGWLLDRTDGVRLGQAQLVVLANAGGALPLLAQWHAQEPTACLLPAVPLQGLRGVMSWGAQRGSSACFPPHPVNGLGALIPSVPGADGLHWYAGATYEAAEQPTPDDLHHARNLERLQVLLPACAEALQTDFAHGQVQAWSGVRWATPDRMPWVGPLRHGPAPNLWICAGMGSRGLSLAALCAELLAAQISAEPLPVERQLAAALDVARSAQRVSRVPPT